MHETMCSMVPGETMQTNVGDKHLRASKANAGANLEWNCEDIPLILVSGIRDVSADSYRAGIRPGTLQLVVAPPLLCYLSGRLRTPHGAA